MHLHWTWTLDGPAVVSLTVAALAALFAGWTGFSAHRSARSDRAAVDLERKRQHLERTPKMRLEESQHGDAGPGVWFCNDGPLDYDSVAFRFASQDKPAPIDALKLGDEWVTSGDLGPLAVGDRRLLLYRRPEQPGSDAILRLRLTCSSAGGSWTVPAEVYITPEPFVF
jgi:hypothetical protein